MAYTINRTRIPIDDVKYPTWNKLSELYASQSGVYYQIFYDMVGNPHKYFKIHNYKYYLGKSNDIYYTMGPSAETNGVRLIDISPFYQMDITGKRPTTIFLSAQACHPTLKNMLGGAMLTVFRLDETNDELKKQEKTLQTQIQSRVIQIKYIKTQIINCKKLIQTKKLNVYTRSRAQSYQRQIESYQRRIESYQQQLISYQQQLDHAPRSINMHCDSPVYNIMYNHTRSYAAWLVPVLYGWILKHWKRVLNKQWGVYLHDNGSFTVFICNRICPIVADHTYEIVDDVVTYKQGVKTCNIVTNLTFHNKYDT